MIISQLGFAVNLFKHRALSVHQVKPDTINSFRVLKLDSPNGGRIASYEILFAEYAMHFAHIRRILFYCATAQFHVEDILGICFPSGEYSTVIKKSVIS